MCCVFLDGGLKRGFVGPQQKKDPGGIRVPTDEVTRTSRLMVWLCMKALGKWSGPARPRRPVRFEMIVPALDAAFRRS
jgi:hypothetical protein